MKNQVSFHWPPHSKSRYPKTPTCIGYHLFPTFLVVIFPFSLLETCYDCYIPILAIPSPQTLNTPQTKSWLLPHLVLDLFIWGIHRQVSLLKRTRFKSKGYPYDLGNLHIERWRKKPDGLHWYRTAPPQQPRTHVPVAEPEAWDIAELVETYGKRTCQSPGNPIHTGTYTWS